MTLAVDAEKLLESDAAPETEQTELDSGDELANENQEKTPISDWPTEQDLKLLSMLMLTWLFFYVLVFARVFLEIAS